MIWIKEKLQNAKTDLKVWNTPHNFYKQMSLVFTNQKIHKDGKMTALSPHKVGAARYASGNLGGTFNGAVSVYYLAQEDKDAVMETTDCLLCCLSMSHVKSHNLAKYPFMEDMGMKTAYAGAIDNRGSNYDKKKITAAKTAAKDKEDEKKVS